MRHLRGLEHLRGTFGSDRFGRLAERGARFFGTPQYIVGQTIVVIAWIVLNAVALMHHWDPYPFILLNLAFSTQAAYAAPLVLLAQTRQAERDQMHAEASAKHLEESETMSRRLLDENTRLTEETRRLASEIHRRVCAPRD